MRRATDPVEASSELSRLTAVRDAALAVLAVTYLAVAARLAWHGDAPPAFSAITMLALVTAIGAVRMVHARWPNRRTDTLAAVWPVAIAPMVYMAEVRVVELLGHGRFVDDWLARVDAGLGLYAGTTPVWPLDGVVEEGANLVYLSYYLIPAIAVWLAVRHGAVEGARVTAALVLATLACGLVWVLLPAGGYFSAGGPTGTGLGPFTSFARDIYATHPHHAAAFPSEHVAHTAALAAVLRARGMRAAIWLWVAAMVAATVLGQYHFALDGAAGWVVGVGAAAAVGWVIAPAQRDALAHEAPARHTT